MKLPSKNALILTLTIILGGFLRFINITPYKIYPDSYLNLIVSLNIRDYQSVIGYLGSLGMVYPYFIAWTRPGFPLATLLTSIFTNNLETGTVLVSFISSALTILLSFFLIRTILKSTPAAFFASFITAISFNNIVWSGFIQTEALSVFLMSAFLSALFANYKNHTNFADIKDFLTGLLLGFCIITRYEYLLIVIPATLLILQNSPSPKTKLLNIFSITIFILTLTFTRLFPVFEMINAISDQLINLAGFVSILIILTLSAVSFRKFIPAKLFFYITQKIKIFTQITIFTLAVYLILQYLFPAVFTFLAKELKAVGDFFETDILLAILILISVFSWKNSKIINPEPAFSFLSIFLLAPIYWKTNPEMQRYILHLYPFLLIIALSNSRLIFKKRLVSFALLPAILLQLYISFWGMRNWDNGEWFKKSYDEQSAILFRQSFENTSDFKDSLLLASFPEAYFYKTRASTYSLTDNPPYIYIDSSLDNKQIYIIEDMGMRDIFPNFSRFLESNLKPFVKKEFWVNETYRYSGYSQKENNPVIVYEIKLSDLKNRLNGEPSK